MGRNNAPGGQILSLEDSIRAGRPYWGNPAPPGLSDDGPPRNASQKVVARMMAQKRARVDLAEDLTQVARRVRAMDEFLKSSNADHLRLPYLLDLLRLQHHSSYLQLMNGLENALDRYLARGSQNNFFKV